MKLMNISLRKALDHPISVVTQRQSSYTEARVMFSHYMNWLIWSLVFGRTSALTLLDAASCTDVHGRASVRDILAAQPCDGNWNGLGFQRWEAEPTLSYYFQIVLHLDRRKSFQCIQNTERFSLFSICLLSTILGCSGSFQMRPGSTQAMLSNTPVDSRA